MADWRKRAIERRGAEAEMLTSPLSSAIETVGNVHKSLKTNDDRTKHVHLTPKQDKSDVATGGFDWLEFYVFCVVIMGYVDMRPQPHDEILKFLAELFPDLTFKTQKQNFGIIMVPRSCFKTVIFSVALPLYLLWKNPNSRGILSAHRHDASKAYLRSVKWHIENNERYRSLCGNLKPRFKETKWAEDSIIVVTRTVGDVDPSIDTCGVDRSKVGAHPDWIICDDLHSEKNVNSALMRQKVYDHIVDFYPMLQFGGTMIIVGTRWHNVDAYSRLMLEDDEAVKQSQEPQYLHMVRSAYIIQNDKKILYFPERLTEAFLEKARRKYKQKFWLWFMNMTVAEVDKLFPKDHLQTPKLHYFVDDDTGMAMIRRSDTGDEVPIAPTLAWDPAGVHPSEESDFHGLSLVCTDLNNRWYIPKAEAFKGPPSKVLDCVIGYILFYNPDIIIIEDSGQSGLWGYMLRQECEKRNIVCPAIVFLKPMNQRTKYDRISTGLQPKWEEYDIVIDPKNRELIEQFDLFPQLDNDDIVDSVHMHLDYARPPIASSEYYEQDVYIVVPKNRHQRRDERARSGSYAGAGSTRWASSALPIDDSYDLGRPSVEPMRPS